MNRAEERFLQEALKADWDATKQGWPDFICFKGDDVICVEVKTTENNPLRPEQIRVMNFLSSKGIKCFKYSLDGKMQPWEQIKEKEMKTREQIIQENGERVAGLTKKQLIIKVKMLEEKLEAYQNEERKF